MFSGYLTRRGAKKICTQNDNGDKTIKKAAGNRGGKPIAPRGRGKGAGGRRGRGAPGGGAFDALQANIDVQQGQDQANIGDRQDQNKDEQVNLAGQDEEILADITEKQDTDMENEVLADIVVVANDGQHHETVNSRGRQGRGRLGAQGRGAGRGRGLGRGRGRQSRAMIGVRREKNDTWYEKEENDIEEFRAAQDNNEVIAIQVLKKLAPYFHLHLTDVILIHLDTLSDCQCI